MDLILRFLVLDFLKGHEWKKARDLSISPFLGVTGCGKPQVVYERSYLPSIFRVMVEGIPPILASLFVVSLIPKNLFSEFLYIFEGLLFLFCLFLGLINLLHSYIIWPTQSPQTVAVFSDGIAWSEGESIRFWPLNNILRVWNNSDYFFVTSQNNQIVRFQIGLYDTDLGRMLRFSTGQIYASTPLMKCPYCGEEIAAESIRCLFCLQSVEIKSGQIETYMGLKTCPNCGENQKLAEDKFCRYCGTFYKDGR